MEQKGFLLEIEGCGDIRIPVEALSGSGFHRNDNISILVKDDEIIIRRLKKVPSQFGRSSTKISSQTSAKVSSQNFDDLRSEKAQAAFSGLKRRRE